MINLNINKILEPIINSTILSDIAKKINKLPKKDTNSRFGGSNIKISGLEGTQASYLTAALKKKLGRPVIFISYSQVQAKKTYEDLIFFLGNQNPSATQVFYYPEKSFISYVADTKSIDICSQRLSVLDYLLDHKDYAIVLSVQALLDRLSELDYFKSRYIELRLGDAIKVDDLERKLFFLGYKRSNRVEGPGQFCLHGGIFDLCDNKKAFRLEFFGDRIDSIRIFNLESQLTQKSNLAQIKIMPVREIIFDKNKFDIALENIKTEFKENNMHDFSELEKRFFNNDIDSYINFFCDRDICLLDYLNNDSLIFLDQPNKIFDSVKNFYCEFIDRVQEQVDMNKMVPSQKNLIIKPDILINRLKDFMCIDLDVFSQDYDFEIRARMPESFKIYSNMFLDNLKKNWIGRKIVFIVCDNELAEKNLIRYLADNDITVQSLNAAQEITNDKVYIMSGIISSSFEFVDLDVIMIYNGTHSSIINTKKPVKKNSSYLHDFLDLKINDYVVHEKHGIGVYKGIEKVTVDGCTKDYLKIEYADGGVLLVKTTQMDFIQKYIGSDKVKISKLGGTEWHKNKLRVKEEVKKIAADLIKLYAKRQSAQGFKFSKDTIWQSEFENLFPYQETGDQLLAIRDVKKDMESNLVMDRLICGDVGYGKTEIAMRAAFKAVQDNKQVVYLVPTTILAQQHYNNFLNRFKDFPINIEMLSRFRSFAQQKKIINNIKSGLLDIIIGTHKLLSSKIKFKDLGLVIIDEEQRFGVSHKEKLKHLRENIDVLTLSATPIPRTLNMSLSGIRDMSLLTQPPSERQPIQTYVLEYNPQVIKNAIQKELDRNGQIYYLYNRIQSIADFTCRLKELVPNANISYAHGQLSELELENIMQNFISGKIDILVCTTIVEAGLDIPNVNTIIINDADKMGLAQLYQLRGRVGRSNRLAYAYLTYRKDKILSETSEKRLKTIREFTEFGAGFKIAMKDLEIRGTGNLLGPQQHGNIDIVGYELYCKLLNQEVKKLKSENKDTCNHSNNKSELKLGLEDDFETNIDINISAYIPDNYIPDERSKLDIYKRISYISSKEDYSDIRAELKDRYGDLPTQLENLLDIAFIKSIAQRLKISFISQNKDNLIMTISNGSVLCIPKLFELIKQDSDLSFKANPIPKITYKNFKPNQKIKKLQQILLQLL